MQIRHEILFIPAAYFSFTWVRNHPELLCRLDKCGKCPNSWLAKLRTASFLPNQDVPELQGRQIQITATLGGKSTDTLAELP